MKKRLLLVFAGQSNMMGAAVYPAPEQIRYADSYEYLHKPRRFGAPVGAFKNTGFPAGEYSYIDLAAAYGENPSPDALSTLADYAKNTYFCPSMCNLRDDETKTAYPFAHFSEAESGMGTTLAPYLVQGLEEAGYVCTYAHIAKGGVSIRHYLEGGAADYFDAKVRDFLADSTSRHAEDEIVCRALVWLQGESDAGGGYEAYRQKLDALWARAKGLGLEKFFMVRVGYWGDARIADVMRAEEDFCRECPDAHMLTRVGSYFPYVGQKPDSWLTEVTEDCERCRDSFFGFGNQHYNDKGFRVIAAHALPNVLRVLVGLEAIPEPERVLALIN